MSNTLFVALGSAVALVIILPRYSHRQNMAVLPSRGMVINRQAGSYAAPRQFVFSHYDSAGYQSYRDSIGRNHLVMGQAYAYPAGIRLRDQETFAPVHTQPDPDYQVANGLVDIRVNR